MNKERMMEFGLLISMAVSNSPSVSLADWEKNDDSNPLPDLMLGGHNDWWLKTNDDGDLYVQCRYHDLGQGDLAELAWRVMGVLDEIEDRWGNVILMPWTPIAIDVALGAWIRKENAVKESLRESRKRAEEEAKRELERIKRAADDLSERALTCALDLDDARYAHAATQDELERCDEAHLVKIEELKKKLGDLVAKLEEYRAAKQRDDGDAWLYWESVIPAIELAKEVK